LQNKPPPKKKKKGARVSCFGKVFFPKKFPGGAVFWGKKTPPGFGFFFGGCPAQRKFFFFFFFFSTGPRVFFKFRKNPRGPVLFRGFVFALFFFGGANGGAHGAGGDLVFFGPAAQNPFGGPVGGVGGQNFSVGAALVGGPRENRIKNPRAFLGGPWGFSTMNRGKGAPGVGAPKKGGGFGCKKGQFFFLAFWRGPKTLGGDYPLSGGPPRKGKGGGGGPAPNFWGFFFFFLAGPPAGKGRFFSQNPGISSGGGGELVDRRPFFFGPFFFFQRGGPPRGAFF